MNASVTATPDLNADPETCAAWVARFLKARGIDRVFGLQGGHIQPLWDHVAQQGIRIIDVRDEGAAVHMAHAHAELAGGFGVALVTAGPGVTNTVTAVANAFLARAPVLLIGGCPPRPQANMGPLQGIPHVDILRPVTRTARTLNVAEQVVREFDEAVARATGDAGEPGPVYAEIPIDVLRARVSPQLVLDEWMQAKPPRRLLPEAAAIAAAVDVFWAAKRPLVITGRGARGAASPLLRLLDATGALYLDTQESRGLVPADHPSVVAAVRGAAMSEADVVLLIGRRLDYQLGYGSPAVFPQARFIRLADNAGELIDNRRGQVELFASPDLALAAMVEIAGNRAPDRRRGLARGHAPPPPRAHRLRGRRWRPAGNRRRRQDPSARDLRRHRRPSRSGLCGGRRRRRSVELCPHRPERVDLHGRRRLRLPGRGRAVRDCRGPRPAGPPGDLG